jgi:HAD superfamily, subfamily IIIB (Acid phosphatase)
MPRRVLGTAFVVLLLALTVLVPATADAAKMPSKSTWVADTYKALRGSRAYVRDRVARSQADHSATKLALNLDIDNTSLATYYAKGKPVAATLRLVKYAKSKGVYILFNTGRSVSTRTATIAGLKRAGYPVDGLCTHLKGESLQAGKQRCRSSYVSHGFTLIANIGNRSTDFVGTSYERAYRLPNYGNRLG